MVQADSLSVPFLRKLFGLGPAMRDVLLAASKTLPVDQLDLCKDPALPNELVVMEERQVSGELSESQRVGVGAFLGHRCLSVVVHAVVTRITITIIIIAARIQVIRSYKFGICYLAEGQSTEEQMFANTWESTSPAFRQFLDFLGERIELKGWKGYRAGLDVKENQTGTHSYYTKWQGYEVMFHVSPMLPYNVSDKQQVAPEEEGNERASD